MMDGWIFQPIKSLQQALCAVILSPTWVTGIPKVVKLREQLSSRAIQ
jgi:hypothetical protein